MAGETAFVLSDPSTWGAAISGLTAGGIGIYVLVRAFRRDNRKDNQEKMVDDSVQQLITNLRSEVERLALRVASMEEELVQLHEERTILLKKVAEQEAAELQPRLL
jgi:hypothetical protein